MNCVISMIPFSKNPANSVTKILHLKKLFELTLSCVRYQAGAQSQQDAGSLKVPQSMSQCFTRFSKFVNFTEFLIHLEITPV